MFVDAVFKALGEQTVTVGGTQAGELVIPRVAGRIEELKHQRAIVAEEVESSWTLPSVRGLDVHAGSRRQDRCQRTPDHQ